MKMFRRLCFATIGILFFAFFLAMGGIVWPFELAFDIPCGWYLFLSRAAGKVHWNLAGIATGTGAVLIFTIGLHYFLAWLYPNFATPAAGSQLSRPAWRLRWTIQAVTIIIFAFIAGISMVGISHQCAWLATSKEPMITNAWGPQRFARMRSGQNLHEMGKGLQDYETQKSAMLPGATADAQGRILHSWQTMLLPYLEEEALYKKIKLSKPWNAPENDANFKFVVGAFINPSVEDDSKDAAGYGLSHYSGNARVMGGTEPLKKADFQGGEARTIVAGEAAGNFKPWGKPGNWRDPKLGINQSPDGFGGNRKGPTIFLKADGGTIGLMDDIDPVVFQSLCTPGGKEPLPEE